MARVWAEALRNAKSVTFKVTAPFVFYYSYREVINPSASTSKTLPKDTVIKCKYDSTTDCMKIIECESNTDAVGYYIKEQYTKVLGNVTYYLTHTTIEIDDNNIVDVTTTTGSNTTIDPNTGSEVPENTDENGDTSGSDSTLFSARYVDDEFVDIEYETKYTNTEEYTKKLQEGLRVKDFMGILGMPHQFLPITDPRIDDVELIGDVDQFGRTYSERIIKHIPLLCMTPGSPAFMAGFSKEQKNKIIGKLADWTEERLESIFGNRNSGKYYSLKYAYTEYFYYVNAMLRSAAYFLEIQDVEIYPNTKLGTMNWLYSPVTKVNETSSIYSIGNLSNFLGPYAGSIAFYVDAGTTADDNFSNSTGASQLDSTMNSLSDTGRELNFLIGNVGGVAGLKLDALTGSDDLDSKIGDLQSKVDNVLGSNSILGNILGKAQTLLAGGRLIFPEIWTDSSFSRSYSCSMKLVSPAGDKLSIFLNILVPIYHLLGFTLPRESTNQAYFSPFLVRAYYKGLFNVDMGIITNLSITKGDEGEWSIDGIPTVANVSFEIKDLYDGMYMSKQTLDTDEGILSNIQELDYIANSCGVNVNDHEVMRMVSMAVSLGFTSVKDKVTIGIFGKVAEYFNQKTQNIFGVF